MNKWFKSLPSATNEVGLTGQGLQSLCAKLSLFSFLFSFFFPFVIYELWKKKKGKEEGLKSQQKKLKENSGNFGYL